MSAESTSDSNQTASRVVQVPALLRFLLAAVLVVIVNLAVPRFCFALFENHFTIADLAYRWSGSLVLIAGFLFLSRVVDQVEGDAWEYMGLPRTRSAVSQLGIGVGWGAALISLAMIPLAATGLEMHLNLSPRALIRMGITTVLLVGGALLEELMFRGYPFQRLLEGIGAVWAIVILSIFFGAVHLNNPNSGGIRSWGFFNTITVGVLFALAYVRTKALWFPIGIHFGWNFFLGVVFGLPVSGIRDFSVVVRSTAHGPKLLTGGAYGIEASLTGSIVIVLGIIAVARVPKWLLGARVSRSPDMLRGI